MVLFIDEEKSPVIQSKKGGKGQMDKGMIHVYYGEGKGKTTAAFGLVFRAVGQGKKVLVCQMLKDGKSGEILATKLYVGQVDIIEGYDFTGFADPSQKDEWERTQKQQQGKFEALLEKMEQGEYDLVLIDELCAAVNLGIITEEMLRQLLIKKPHHTEMVITGREPHPLLLEAADYLSKIECVKHPYEKGVPARKGIEW